jgi:O-antigen/teichoic acid export membrane protein
MSSDNKSSFFRQSGWMVIATFIGGLFMAGVQILAQNPKVMQEAESNTLIALLRLLMLFGTVPSAALQTIFTQQAAAAVTGETRGQLTASVRAVLRATFIFWFALAGLGLLFAGPISLALKINNPTALRITMLAVLAVLWGPTLKGLLQGLHRFGPLGGLTSLEGVVRLGTFFMLVKWLQGGATGGVWAIFIGQYLIVAIALWLTRDVWSVKTSAGFSWKVWSIRGVPLSLGMGACIFMSSQMDSVFVNSLSFSSKEVKLYICAMLIGFSMTQFIAPIANVMFPTIVRNLALSNKSDPLVLTLGVTGGFACVAAAGATLFPRLPVWILFRSYMDAAVLVPWYAWAMVPLTLANVLIQNLLARGRFAATLWLVLVPVLYVLTLKALAPEFKAMPDYLSAFRSIILVMGFFNLALLAVAAWFTWRKPAKNALIN